jgi:hypothetical protein
LALGLCLWLAGCLIPPDPLPVIHPGPALIHIDKILLEPALDPPPPPLDRALLAQFDARTAVITRDVTRVLHYAWYGDVDDKSGIPLQYYHACPNTSRCPFFPCIGLKNLDEDDHRLLLVVSDAPLPESAKNPFDFPEGAAVDWVEWQLTLVGKCLE